MRGFGMFAELNRKRLQFLFGYGIPRQRLKRFLDERKPALELRGAKYRHRGQGTAADLAFLINLDQKCVPTLRAWCLDEIKTTVNLAPAALIAQFLAIENETGELSGDDAAQFAGAGLRFLFEEPPAAAWIEFLRSPIGRNAEKREEQSLPMVEVEERAEPDEQPDTRPDIIVPILRKLRSDDGDGARTLIGSLPASAIKTELDELARRFRSRPRELAPIASEMRALTTTDGLEPEKIAVLLRRSRETRPGQPIFMDVCGLVLEGGLYRLSEQQVFELFEHRHHVITFRDSKSLRVPAVGELCLWYVEKTPTDLNVKFRLRKPAGHLYVVIDLASSFQEFDQVRTEIQQASIDPWMRPMFRLAGGGFLRPPTDATGPVKGIFDEPFQLYRSVPVWNVLGSMAILSPLPSPDGAYDCADLSVVTGRILKESEFRQHLPEMTRGQVSELIASLGASDMGLTDQRLERVTQEFDRYITSAEKLRLVTSQVLKAGDVQEAIASAVETAVSSALEENQQLKGDRSRLSKEIADLKGRRSNLIEEHKRTADEIRGIVRKAFEKAKDAGSKSLGEIAVFAALLDSQRPHSDANTQTEYSIRTWEAHPVDDPQRPLMAFGLSAGNSRIVSIGAKLIANAGIPLLITGPRSSQLGLAIGQGLARGRCIVAEVPIGAVNSLCTKVLIENSNGDDSLVIRNYNLSALDAFGSPLIDLLSQSMPASQPARAGMVFSASKGLGSLPLDDDLCALAVVINSSFDYNAEVQDFEVTRDELREDRGASRIKSLALVRVLESSKEWPTGELEAVLAIIAAQRDAITSSQGMMG
jgi:hypothetical protein